MQEMAVIKSKNPDLTEAQIRGIFDLILTHSNLSNLDLIRLTGLPKETWRHFKNSISSYLEDVPGEFLQLNPEGVLLFKQYAQKYSFSTVNLKDSTLTRQLQEVRSKYRISPKRDLDQFFATEATSVSKVLYAHSKGLLENKKVAILGDDDLLSVVIVLAKIKYTELTIFEVDTELLTLLKTILTDLGNESIHFIHYDSREDLSRLELSKYDTVLIDPPYTITGVSFFLKRSLELLNLKDTLGKDICLFYGNSFKTPEKFLKIQELIARYNLQLIEKLHNFAQYYGADSIGSNSSLYWLKTTQYTNPQAVFIDETNFYTHQTTPTEKFPYVDHIVMKVKGVPSPLLKSKQGFVQALNTFCTRHKLKAVDKHITYFKEYGLSVTYILANSNLVAHTWPEYGALHLDLITCSPVYNKHLLSETLKDLFQAVSAEITQIE